MIQKLRPREGYQEDGANKQSDVEVKLGDTIWLKPDGHLWWPAQVYDENAVSEGSKPDKRSMGEVFVRFYGSYTFSYVNPTKYTSEFESLLRKNDGNYRKILQDSIDKRIDISKCHSQKTHEGLTCSLNNEKLNENGTRRKKNTNGLLARRAVDGPSRARASKTSSVAKNAKKQSSMVPRQVGVHKRVKKEESGCNEELECKSSAKGSRAVGKRKPGIQNVEVEEGSKSRVKKLKANTPKKKQKPGSPVLKEQAKRRTLNKEKQQTKAIAMKKVKKEHSSLIEPQVTSPKEAKESSARKMRVMQVLGLVPPSVSQFP